GFGVGWSMSVGGFLLLGLGYLHFSDQYVRDYPQSARGFRLTPEFDAALSAYEAGKDGRDINEFRDTYAKEIQRAGGTADPAVYGSATVKAALDAGAGGASLKEGAKSYEGKILNDRQPFWSNLV